MILIAKFKEISADFILKKLAQNLKKTLSKVKTHLYTSDPEDCLIFNYQLIARVQKHHVIGTVWEVQFTDEDFHIDLKKSSTKTTAILQSEKTLGTRLLRRRSRASGGGGGGGRVEERDMTDVDEEALEEEQDPRVRTTSSGRVPKLPNRFY